MAVPYRTKQLKSLLKTWNQILEETGFVDIEVEIKGERVLKQKATNCYRNASDLERETRLDYFLMLGHLAHNTEFPSDLEKIVMIRHSEGATIKEIQDTLEGHGFSIFRKTVMFIIRRWQHKWGLRTWTLTQMNLKNPKDIKS